MFFFGKGRKKKPDKTPVWFMWLMGLFMAYALLTNLFTDKVGEAKQAQRENQSEAERDGLNFAVVRGLSAGAPALPLHARERKPGSGDMTGCWYSVAVRYRLYNGEGLKIEDNTDAEEPLRFTIGKGEVIPALERGVLGMRRGGEREVTAQPSLAYAHEGFSHPRLGKADYVGYVLTLEEMERPVNLPFSDLGLRIYDDKEGDGPMAQCTDVVRIRLRGYDMHGKALLGDFPVMLLRVGEGIAPYAVERAAIGMKVGGKRTVIVPPGYLKPLFGGEPEPIPDAEELAAEAQEEMQEKAPDVPKNGWQDLPVPQDRVIILELELLPRHLQLLNQNP